jgi:ribosomal protein S8
MAGRDALNKTSRKRKELVVDPTSKLKITILSNLTTQTGFLPSIAKCY